MTESISVKTGIGNKRFKVGDHVTCNTAGIYNRTIPGIICSVIDVDNDNNDIFVQIEQGPHKGEQYLVTQTYFDFVYNFVEATTEEVLSLMV